MNEKALLRRMLRSAHPGREERDRQSAMICEHILQSDWYREARIIGGYMPLPREADILPVLQDALNSGKTLALPLCGEPPRMTLRRVASLEQLTPGAYGIPEPDAASEIISPAALDLLLVPLEGIDDRGMRLGKGGGYYDCLLAQCSVRTMGCALQWQWTERVPAEEWDRPLAACAGLNGVRYFENEK